MQFVRVSKSRLVVCQDIVVAASSESAMRHDHTDSHIGSFRMQSELLGAHDHNTHVRRHKHTSPRIQRMSVSLSLSHKNVGVVVIS